MSSPIVSRAIAHRVGDSRWLGPERGVMHMAIGAVLNAWIPVSLLVTVAIFIVVGLFLRYHRVGRDMYAVGGNREPARAAGVRVDRIRIGGGRGDMLRAATGVVLLGLVQILALGLRLARPRTDPGRPAIGRGRRRSGGTR